MRTDPENCAALHTCSLSLLFSFLAQVCLFSKRLILINTSTVLYPLPSNLPPSNTLYFCSSSQHNLLKSLTVLNLCFLVSFNFQSFPTWLPSLLLPFRPLSSLPFPPTLSFSFLLFLFSHFSRCSLSFLLASLPSLFREFPSAHLLLSLSD